MASCSRAVRIESGRTRSEDGAPRVDLCRVDQRERGIDQPEGSFEGDERAGQAAEPAGEPYPVAPDEHRQVLEGVGRDPSARPHVTCQHVVEIEIELADIGPVVHRRHLGERLPQHGGVPRSRPGEHLQNQSSLVRAESSHCTEIDQDDGAVVFNQDVAGVGIGVEHASVEDLGHEGVDETASDLAGVEPERGECFGVGDRAAADLFLGEHPLRGEGREYGGHAHPVGVRQGDGECVAVGGFDAEVELLTNVVDELGGELGRPQRQAESCTPLDERSQLHDGGTVQGDRPVEAGSLDLDDNSRAVASLAA